MTTTFEPMCTITFRSPGSSRADAMRAISDAEAKGFPAKMVEERSTDSAAEWTVAVGFRPGF